MPPKKSRRPPKRPASPAENKEQPVGKRTRAQTTSTSTAQSSTARPRPKPKMRPLAPPDDEAEAEPTPTKSKQKASSGGLKLSSRAGRPVSNASVSAKGQSAKKILSDSDYGEEEIDELEDDVDEPEPPTARDHPARSVRKVTLRVTPPAGRPTSNHSEPDTPEQDQSVNMAKIAFSVEKDGVESRPIHIAADIDFETFSFRTAQSFGEVAGQQDLVWKSNRMAKSVKWRELANEQDFKLLMEVADLTLQEELDKFCTVTTANREAEKKAKSKGKAFVPKTVHPLADFIILLRDRNQEKRIKEAKSSKKEKKPAKSESAGRSVGLAERIIACRKVIEARECKGCEKNCVILPGTRQNPESVHKELGKEGMRE
ncbi:hypothetical protein FRC09_009895 [Ceratobasidium sp. 395]|nr:hypothetical protein FRC09_009895 [Ceratobasidium sp. 395]